MTPTQHRNKQNPILTYEFSTRLRRKIAIIGKYDCYVMKNVSVLRHVLRKNRIIKLPACDLFSTYREVTSVMMACSGMTFKPRFIEIYQLLKNLLNKEGTERHRNVCIC